MNAHQQAVELTSQPAADKRHALAPLALYIHTVCNSMATPAARTWASVYSRATGATGGGHGRDSQGKATLIVGHQRSPEQKAAR